MMPCINLLKNGTSEKQNPCIIILNRVGLSSTCENVGIIIIHTVKHLNFDRVFEWWASSCNVDLKIFLEVLISRFIDTETTNMILQQISFAKVFNLCF